MLGLFNNAVQTGGITDLSNDGKSFVNGGLERIYTEKAMACLK
jgi:hypothetical protein